jgi:hypothetical protein
MRSRRIVERARPESTGVDAKKEDAETSHCESRFGPRSARNGPTVPRYRDERSMKRTAIVVVSFVVAGAAVFGFVKVVPTVRDAIDTQRHIRQAALRAPGAEADWRKEFGDPDRTLAAFPSHEDSEKAVRLIELARTVGIDLARSKSRQPGGGESGDKRALSRAISQYDEAELTRPGGKVEPPPGAVRAFLEERDREIGDVVTFLSTSGPPEWKVDVRLAHEAPVPNLLGQIRLQRLLVAQALNRAQLGRENEAEQVFHASWNLNASLRDRPDIISQLIAIAIARMQAGLARRLPLDPAPWRERFADHDYRASVLRALEVESIAGVRGLPADSSLWDRASRADFFDLRRNFLVGLRDSPVADKQIEISSERYLPDSQPRSPGAIIEMIPLPNLAGAIRRADRLIIDMELTERILEARMLKAGLGLWPTGIPGIEISRMPGEHWTYFVSNDGRMTIYFSRELQWEGQQGWMLPLRYESN